MKSKIQFLKQSSRSTIFKPHKEYTGDALTIGRSTTQDVFLADPLVALEHARIYSAGAAQVYLQAMTKAGVEINNRIEKKALLKSGDKITIGSFILTVFESTDDYDLILIVEQRVAIDISGESTATSVLPTKSQSVAPSYLPMNLSQTWLNKRYVSWGVVLLIVLLFMAIPLFGLYYKQPPAVAALLPSDQLWQSGSLSHVHQHFGHDCSRCHNKKFVMVQNVACIECHEETHAHAQADISLQSAGRCGQCHKEHNGSLALSPSAQKICVDCHHDLKLIYPDSALLNVSDFGNAHQQFSPLVRAEDRWQRISMDDPELSHNSGLNFSHAQHLNTKGIVSPNGSVVLGCADCHTPEPGGAYLLPIKMETHCQSCHELTFDPLVPNRVVPHSDLEGLSVFLQEFYALKALQGGYQSQSAPGNIRRRRRPDERMTAGQQKEILQWAEKKAIDVTRELVEVRTCSVCHMISQAQETVVGWEIDKVFASSKWFALAAFNHAKHDSQACTDCHNAGRSDASSDVLLPKLDDCRKCHGGESAENKYASTCIVCHKFHLDSAPLYSRSGMEAHSDSFFRKAQEFIKQ